MSESHLFYGYKKLISINKNLNFLHLKLVAIVAMTIDHFAWLFVETSSFEGQALHFVGRITAPIMCFLLVEGFYQSQNIKKYVGRLFIFAILSQLPFAFMLKGWESILNSPILIFYKLNILFNLLLGLLTLVVWSSTLHFIIRFLLVSLFLLLSTMMDWGVFIIIFVCILGLFRKNRNQQIISYLMAAMGLLLLVDLGVIGGLPTLILQWMPLGILIVPIFLWKCNYQFGHRFGGKYFFYAYYPIHMFILAFFKYSF